MRRLCALCLVIFAGMTLKAQEAKQTYLAGTLRSSVHTASSGGSIDFSAGKFIKENQLLGLRGGTSLRLSSASDQDAYDAMMGVFYRKYRPLLEKLNLFYEAEAAYRRNWSNNTFSDREYLGQFCNLSGNLGLALQVRPKLNLEAHVRVLSASYSHVRRVTYENDVKFEYVDTGVNVSALSLGKVQFGLSFIF